MEKIVLQPAANKVAQEHFSDTVRQHVSLERLREGFREDQMEKLERLYPSGSAPVWGVTPTSSGRKEKEWRKIEYGDIALFSKEGEFFASSSITLKTQSPGLAADLWGVDGESGKTWEYIYLLDTELVSLGLPYKPFNKAVGYAANYFPQSLRVLDKEKSERAVAEFEFGTEGGYDPSVGRDEFESTVDRLEELREENKSLDQKRETLWRREQKMLRSHLFGRRDMADCTLCTRSFPTDILVAAHIKKRSECDREERLDYKNNVVPMCKLGCDDLFEHGYLVVENGVVHQGPRDPTTDAVRQYVDQAWNVKCQHWNDDSAPYFRYHRQHVQ